MKSTLTLVFSLLLSMVHAQGKEMINSLLNDNHTQRSSGAFAYSLSTFTEPYTDLTGATSVNNGEVWDDPAYTISIPFPFVLNGNEISFLQLGGLQGGALLSAPTNDPEVFTLLFLFETDLVDRGYPAGPSLSPISVKTEGAVGSRILKLEFKNAGSNYERLTLGTVNMFINFQLWLYEGSNMIEFRFGPSSIEDPSTFYSGLSGAFIGLTDYFENEDLLINPHIIVGDVASPNLSTVLTRITGTPSNGTVYRLTLDIPLEIQVSGTNASSFCNPNGSATVEVTGGVGLFTFLWSNSETTQTITNLDAGTYTVTVTDSNGSTATDSVVITNVTPLSINAQSTNETAVGANDGTALAAPTGGLTPYSYQWSSGQTTALITGLTPGVYTVTVTDAAGCTQSETVTVDAFGCPPLTIQEAIIHANCFGVCDGTIEIQNVTNGVHPLIYLWENGDTNEARDFLCAGSYSVTITDASGCNVSETFQINQPAPLQVNATSTDETAPNANDGTASAAPTGGTAPYGFLWSTGSTAAQITGLPPGSYTVTVTDANLCTSSQTVAIDTFDCELGGVQILNASCNGSCDGSIVVSVINVIAPVSYLWSNGAVGSALEGLCVGDYTLTTTDAGGCNLILTFTVTEPPILQANASSTNETASDANDGTAWAVPSGGTPPYTFAWNTGSTDSLITGLAPGIYTVAVTDAQGCIDSQDVVVNEFLCIDITGVSASNASCFGVCDGALSVTVSGAGPFLYQWTSGQTTPMITDLCADIYTLVIIDSTQNCFSDVISFEITQPEVLFATIDEVIHITDSTTSSVQITASGGIAPYTYSWTGINGFSAVTEDLINAPADVYTLVITDANGCVFIQNGIEIRDQTVGIGKVHGLQVRIYPNPVEDNIYIDIESYDDLEIELLTLEGRIVDEWNGTNKINVQGVSSGFYLLKLVSGDKFSVERIVVK